MFIIGVDLSGPASPDRTALGLFRRQTNSLEYVTLITSVDDGVLYSEVRDRLSRDDVAIGLDAPLSYGRTGGQRRSDADLREKIVEAGLLPGSVMAPTAPRMAYLSLRGLAVARGLHLLGGPGSCEVVETHPGAAMVLGGAPLQAVRTYRDDLGARDELLQWLADQGIEGIRRELVTTDHAVAAFAAAWATWQWILGDSNWLHPAEPPHHPFDFAC